MSFLDRLEAARPIKKPDLSEWLDSLTPEELKHVEQAGRDWSIHALEQFIRGEGVAVSDVSILKWKSTL